MKRQKDEEGGQEWLNTYADMITLVLTFFVLLYSISNVNLTKLEEVASAMQRQLGIEAKTEIEDVPSDLKYPVVGEGAQAPEDAEAPLQQTQQPTDELEQLNQLVALTGITQHKGLLNLDKKPVLHQQVCAKEQISATVQQILGL